MLPLENKTCKCAKQVSKKLLQIAFDDNLCCFWWFIPISKHTYALMNMLKWKIFRKILCWTGNCCYLLILKSWISSWKSDHLHTKKYFRILSMKHQRFIKKCSFLIKIKIYEDCRDQFFKTYLKSFGFMAREKTQNYQRPPIPLIALNNFNKWHFNELSIKHFVKEHS